MTSALDRPLSCPVVVGRGAALETLESLIASVPGGRGGTVLIAGEAGIGKTRLVAEARALAGAHGIQVLTGACFEADRAVAYAPLVDFLRALIGGRSTVDLAQALGAQASLDLAELIPELAPLGPDSPASRDSSRSEGVERRRAQAIAQLIEDHSRQQPLLAIFEDLHWSDQASLEVLRHLARRALSAPLQLILTYRSDELSGDLRHLLAELDRERLAAELRLRQLEPAHVAAMVRSTLGLDRALRADLADVVYGLTEGNPFFIEEVLRSLLAEGDLAFTHGAWIWAADSAVRVPRTVHDAVQRRSTQLGDAARDVLALAAVAGRRFDYRLLQALSGRADDDLLQALKQLIAAGLVVEESADLFTFRHALTRQAVLTDLLARERRALHRRVADTLEALYAGDQGWMEEHAGDLAYHCAEAEDWPRAFGYARRAGERATTLNAPQVVVEQLTRAVHAAERQRLAVPWSVFWQRGHAHEIRGNFDEARVDLEAALGSARASGDRTAEWHTLVDLGVLWSGRDYAHSGQHFQAALELARCEDDPLALARSLNRYGNWLANQGRAREAVALHEEALALVEARAARADIARTLDLLGMASHLTGNAAAASGHWQRAIQEFRALGDQLGLASSLATYGVLGSEHDAIAQPADFRLDLALQRVEESLAIARATGWRPGEAFAQVVRLLCLVGRGDYARAFAVMPEVGLAEELGHRQWTTAAVCELGLLYLDLMDLPRARQHLERGLQLARQIQSRIWIGNLGHGLAVALAELGEGQRADLLLDELAPERPPRTVADALLLRARAEVALLRGAPDEALAVTDELLVMIAGFEPAGNLAPRLLLVRGQALVALGQTEAGIAALEEARAATVTLGTLPVLWRVDVALGHAHARARRSATADEAFARARTCADALGASIPDESTRALFTAGVAALVPAPRPLTTRRAAKAQYGGLTARERDVAALIVHGLSNRQIADRLVLSERTVEAHVRSILDRLGLHSRAQIAAWAQAHGLAASIRH